MPDKTSCVISSITTQNVTQVTSSPHQRSPLRVARRCSSCFPWIPPSQGCIARSRRNTLRCRRSSSPCPPALNTNIQTGQMRKNVSVVMLHIKEGVWFLTLSQAGCLWCFLNHESIGNKGSILQDKPLSCTHFDMGGDMESSHPCCNEPVQGASSARIIKWVSSLSKRECGHFFIAPWSLVCQSF